MKIAVLIAHTVAGWSVLACGEDVGGIKARFKQIKVAGILMVGDQAADQVMLFDSAGNVRRKGLDGPDDIVARQRLAAAELDRAKKVEAAKAEAEGKDLAHKAAQAAVGAVKEAITIAAEPPPPAAAEPPAGDAPAEGEPSDHFGAGRKPRRH